MEKIIIKEFNKLSKWVITKGVSFIGHECTSGKSLFTFMKIKGFKIHIEIFFDDVNTECVVNVYEDKKHLLNVSGVTEECLKELDLLINNLDMK